MRLSILFGQPHHLIQGQYIKCFLQNAFTFLLISTVIFHHFYNKNFKKKLLIR